MAKAKLGVKRRCAECGKKFYDLNREPPVCPKCDAVFEIPVAAAARPRPETASKEPAKKTAEAGDPPETPEVISLEEADAEASGEDLPDIDDDDIEDVDTDIGGDQEFLDTDDDDDDDVTSIGVDVKNEKDE